MTVLHIKSITTNAKSANGEASAWELSPKTLIVGPNEAGKSSIAQSAQVLSEGGASGLMLRRGLVKLPALLMGMAPANEPLKITATLSDGRTLNWEALPGKRPTTNVVPSDVSVEGVRAAFSGAASTARAFLASAMGGTAITLDALAKSVPPAYANELTQLLAGLPSDLSFEDLLNLATLAGKHKKAASDDAKANTLMTTALEEMTGASQAVNMDTAREDYRVSILADFFKTAGKAAKDANEAGDPEPMKAARWLAAQIGGRTVLAGAKPLGDVEQQLAGALSLGTVGVARSRAASALLSAGVWGNLETTLSDLADTLIDAKLVPEFERRVNLYMPDSDRFALDRASMLPGVYRYGRLHTALSGSTEARVLAAMTAALAKPDQLTVLVVDDRMWDGITLARTLRALEDAPCQVIVMSTMLPRGRRRQSWGVIELDARYAREEEEA
jgi:hypothetical protein